MVGNCSVADHVCRDLESEILHNVACIVHVHTFCKLHVYVHECMYVHVGIIVIAFACTVHVHVQVYTSPKKELSKILEPDWNET